jgi:AraC family transcriptional activator of tynA and feaB
MRTLFSTMEVHPRDRFDYWHDVASKNIVEHASSPECRRTFRAEIHSGSVSDIGLVRFENSAMNFALLPRHAARANADELFVCRQEAGLVTLEQDTRELVLKPGDITLLDPRLLYAGQFTGESGMLVLKVPRRQLEARVGKTREMTARAIRAQEPEGSLISALLTTLPAYCGRVSETVAEIVKDKVLDLVAVSLAKALDGQRARVSSPRSLALISVRVAIEARLTDPALDTSTVAAAAGISVRYANAVLADENTSIMRLILTRRLKRCRKALEDPAQAHRTVSEIAYGWGFSDMTHFGRKFRAAYGVLPSEYRKTGKAD